MIIKITGMAIVLVSSALIGFCFAECMASRERELFNLSDAIDAIINELEFTLNPLGEIIAAIVPSVRGKAKLLTETLCSQIQEGETVPKAWEHALKSCGPSMSLKQSDCNFLSSCGSLLDAYEIDEQINRLQILKSRILQLADEANREKNKNSKMVRMMGIYGGLLLCVIIF